MYRSSESIGTLAAALAKAQAELTNPEKSLVATIRSPFPREADRKFRYAPLSSGLDIVRKSLGRNEIATIQTTAIDKEAGLLRLTTVLAHSSGEWIASEWPVCQIADVSSAQRMGAALTYARRYALFALVGIVGEDDLDAPDLGVPLKPGNGHALGSDQQSQLREGVAVLAQQPIRRSTNRPEHSALPILSPQQSAVLRDRLLADLTSINSADQAATWACRNLPAKNTLTAEDAQIVEERFRARLSTFGDGKPAEEHPNLVSAQIAVSADPAERAPGRNIPRAPKKRSRNADVRALGKIVRLRDKEHRRFVARQPCLVCGRAPCDAHHLTFTQPRALGSRVSDEFIVPVCRIHHRELHR